MFSGIEELKFTPENLKRHLKAYPYLSDKLIYTTRKSIKGEKGDIFFVKGVGYFALVDITIAGCLNYDVEGFTHVKEYADELLKLYGRVDDLYLHKFLKLNDEQVMDGEFNDA